MELIEAQALAEDVSINSRSDKINVMYRLTMKRVFSPAFYNKIDKIIGNGKRIQVNEFEAKNNVVAYTQGHNLHVNSTAFYAKSPSDALVYLMHETIHLLMNYGQFRELKTLNKALYKLVSKNLEGDMSIFLTGKRQPLHSFSRDEVLTYLMNKSLNFKMTKNGTKEQYIKLLEESGIFNLSSSYFNFLRNNK